MHIKLHMGSDLLILRPFRNKWFLTRKNNFTISDTRDFKCNIKSFYSNLSQKAVNIILVVSEYIACIDFS